MIVQLSGLSMLFSSLSNTVVANIILCQVVFHNIMTCRVFRMMKLDSRLGLDTTHLNLTPIAFGDYSINHNAHHTSLFSDPVPNTNTHNALPVDVSDI